MPQTVKLALHDVPHPEALARLMQRAATELAREFPAILGCRLSAERLAAFDGKGHGFEIHLELLFPQHQIVLNRAGATPKAALDAALGAARREIERVASRDPAVALYPRAKKEAEPLPAAA